MEAADTFDLRAHDRFRLEPMYTAVTVQRVCEMVLRNVEGHAYDVSEAGARLELDEPLAVGERIALGLRLPGETRSVYASARVVWVHDDEEDPGARRAAIQFTRFLTAEDHGRLNRYLGHGLARRCA